MMDLRFDRVWRSFPLLPLLALLPVGITANAAEDPSLIAWWTFDAVENGVVKDLSGHGLHAVAHEAKFDTGKSGKAFRGDGKGYLEVAYSPMLDDFAGGITISAWVYMDGDSGPSYNCIVTREIRDTWSEYFDLAVLKNRPLFAVDPDGAHYSQTDYKSNLPLREWHHLAGTFDGKTYKLYVDGKEAASGKLEIAFRFADKNPLIIGSNTNDQGKIMHDFFLGRIDDLKIYRRPLSADELARLP